MPETEQQETGGKKRTARRYVVASILLILAGFVLLAFAKPSLLRDIDPVERILAPILNALGLNG